MTTVVLTVHVLIVLALIGVVLLQRSEGGALGMGGGGGGFMTGRGAANVLTRTTSVLAFLFFATSLTLAIFADRGESEESVLQELTRPSDQPVQQDPTAPPSTDDLLKSLGAEPDTTNPAPDAAVETPPATETAPDAQTPDEGAPAEDEPPAQEPGK